ncbi:MAG: hypothetical protein ACOYB3_01515 [Azonexus sp.]
MKHVKIDNNSHWQTDEIMPLLQVAWNSARPEFKRPCDARMPLMLAIGNTRRRAWYCKIRPDYARLAFSAPGARDGHNSQVGTTPVQGMNEIIIGVAAWCFIAAKGNMQTTKQVCQAVTRDAVREYRSHKAEVDAKIASIIQGKKDKEGEEFAREVFDGLEKSTLEYKLSQIEKKEKVWRRKLALANTKLKSLRRKKAAIVAADTRKKRKEAQVAAVALPPTSQQQP